MNSARADIAASVAAPAACNVASHAAAAAAGGGGGGVVLVDFSATPGNEGSGPLNRRHTTWSCSTRTTLERAQSVQ